MTKAVFKHLKKLNRIIFSLEIYTGEIIVLTRLNADMKRYRDGWKKGRL